MSDTDRQLDIKSRRLLGALDELKDLETKKRRAARSTPEFHALADEIDQRARGVFVLAHEQLEQGRKDSPIPAERAEQKPGDWTSKGRN